MISKQTIYIFGDISNGYCCAICVMDRMYPYSERASMVMVISFTKGLKYAVPAMELKNQLEDELNKRNLPRETAIPRKIETPPETPPKTWWEKFTNIFTDN